MANKRMFTMKIVDSDAFLDMPLSTQCLYFHLNMRADDDGFINNPRKIMRIIGASEDDLKLLIAKSFIITFENGVIVIKHWRMHNTLSKQRYKETQYIEEKNTLRIKENGSYSLCDGKAIDDHKLIEMNQRRTSGEQVENTDIDLDIDIDIDNNICASAPSKADVDALFESVWSLYPNKKGKGQVSDAKKRKLHSIGYDELKRAIDRYKKDLAKDSSWRKPQNGSTFFNSGYVDYLDKNYTQSAASSDQDDLDDLF